MIKKTKMSKQVVLITVSMIVMAGVCYSVWSIFPLMLDFGSYSGTNVTRNGTQSAILGSRLANNEVSKTGQADSKKSRLPPQTKETKFNGVSVKIYTPEGVSEGLLPGLVYYHGGGWVRGSVKGVDRIVTRLCQDANAVVVSVDYRLATSRTPFPIPFEDCFNATTFFLKNAKKYNVDPLRIGLAGESAGGNLAAAVALKLRDDAVQPVPRVQVLVSPVTQGVNFQLPSMVKFKDGPGLSAKIMAHFVSMYLEGHSDHQEIFLENGHVAPATKKALSKSYLNMKNLPEKYLTGYAQPSLETGDAELFKKLKSKLMNPYFSPLVAKKLSGLPTAFVMSAENDPLRDEAILYVRRLEKAKNQVTHYHTELGNHGTIYQLGESETEKAFDAIKAFLTKNL